MCKCLSLWGSDKKERPAQKRKASCHGQGHIAPNAKWLNKECAFLHKGWQFGAGAERPAEYLTRQKQNGNRTELGIRQWEPSGKKKKNGLEVRLRSYLGDSSQQKRSTAQLYRSLLVFIIKPQAGSPEAPQYVDKCAYHQADNRSSIFRAYAVEEQTAEVVLWLPMCVVVYIHQHIYMCSYTHKQHTEKDSNFKTITKISKFAVDKRNVYR